MNEFVEECRKEWRRLGVPDPIANEMAADLTADIDEAESEGGSAEDVLGNSLFDPRRFAASWAGARGVTDPLAPVTVAPAPAPVPASVPPSRRRWIAAAALAGVGAFLVLGALALAVGHRSASAAIAVRRVIGPGPVHWFKIGPPAHGARFTTPGPSIAVGFPPGVAIIAVLMLLIGAVGLGLAVVYWAPWTRRVK